MQPGPGSFVPKHRGNIGRAQHSVRDAPPEGRFPGKGFVEMDWIDVAGDLREGVKSVTADDVDEACLHADMKVLEKVPRSYRGGHRSS